MSSSDESSASSPVSPPPPVTAKIEVEEPKIKIKKSKRSRELVDPSTTEPIEPTSTTSTTTTESTADDTVAEPEIPALSHKEKRLAKRRKLLNPELDSTSTSLPSSTSSLPPLQKSHNTIPGVPNTIIGNTPSKSAFGIWVGNLSFGTTQKMLLGWFESKGLGEVVRLNMPSGKRLGEVNRGFAYLDFPTSTEVTIAVALSEQHLDGRKLLIKSSSDFTGRPSLLPLPSSLDPSSLSPSTSSNFISTSSSGQTEGPAQTLSKSARKILSSQKNNPGPTLFVGNLGFETTIEEIRNMFDVHQRGVGIWAPKVRLIETGEEGKIEVELEESKGEVEEEEDDEDGGSGSDSDDSEAEEQQPEEPEAIEQDESIDLTTLPLSLPSTSTKRTRTKPDKNQPKDLSKANDAGIRKIRLGTFEDTGKCKGWAFIDFHLPLACTRALLNPKNHSLNGRSLIVEYASSEAVRRGNIGTRAAINANLANGRGGGRPGSRGGRAGFGARDDLGGGNGGGGKGGKKGRDWDDQDLVSSVKKDYFDEDSRNDEGGEVEHKVYIPRDDSSSRGRGGGRGGRGGDSRGGRGGRGGNTRMTPGAALAAVQRSSEAIVESRGKKITFD